MGKLLEVQEALCQFIINTVNTKTSGNEVQALPEVVKALIELSKFIRTQKYFKRSL
jgi:hypothetical protein